MASDSHVRHSQLSAIPEQSLPFRIVSKTIGSGAYACIKKAIPKVEKEPVFAVKFIHKAYASKYGQIKPKQLQMECSLHQHVGVHDNVIEFYRSGEDDTWTWIAMELAEGGDLFDKIEADAGCSEDIAHVYFLQLIAGVDWMHKKGVGHRDLKPENLLLDAEGRLKIADFGLATLFEYKGKRKLAVTLCGSPPYVAPEVLAQGGQKDRDKSRIGYEPDKADIWSVGVILFVLLAGNTPWDKPVAGTDEWGRPNEFKEYLDTNGRPDDELWHQLPQSALKLIRGMLLVDTEQRYKINHITQTSWFNRKNKYINSQGTVNQIELATQMFESLHVAVQDQKTLSSLGKHRSQLDPDAMDIDSPRKKLPASSLAGIPENAVAGEWESDSQRFTQAGSNAVRSHARIQSSAQNVGPQWTQTSTQTPTWLEDEPSMSQFMKNPRLPIRKTQLAQKFNDILPAATMTRFITVYRLNIVMQSLLHALMQIDCRVPQSARDQKWSASDGLSSRLELKISLEDDRKCPMAGVIVIEELPVEEYMIEIVFKKATGDPSQWRRFFKKIVVLCEWLVFRPDS